MSYLATEALDIEIGREAFPGRAITLSSVTSGDISPRILSSASSARLAAFSKPNISVMKKQQPKLNKINKSNDIYITSIVYVTV